MSENMMEQWGSVIKFVSPFISEQEKQWLVEYVNEVGEYEEAFDLLVALIRQKKN